MIVLEWHLVDKQKLINRTLECIKIGYKIKSIYGTTFSRLCNTLFHKNIVKPLPSEWSETIHYRVGQKSIWTFVETGIHFVVQNEFVSTTLVSDQVPSLRKRPFSFVKNTLFLCFLFSPPPSLTFSSPSLLLFFFSATLFLFVSRHTLTYGTEESESRLRQQWIEINPLKGLVSLRNTRTESLEYVVNKTLVWLLKCSLDSKVLWLPHWFSSFQTTSPWFKVRRKV